LWFRTTRGIDLDVFNCRFGLDFYETFREIMSPFEKDEQLKVTNTHCRLTPKGMVLLDAITAAFTNQDMPEGRW
jgi:coproporphyrinogen III oxidase-like Fe-S oxidoreductase